MSSLSCLLKKCPLEPFLTFFFFKKNKQKKQKLSRPQKERRVLRSWPQGAETSVVHPRVFSAAVTRSASPGSDLTPFALFWLIVDFVCCAVFNNHLFVFFIQIYFFMPLIVLYSARGQTSLAFLVWQRRLPLSFMPYCYVDMSNVASTCARAWALSSPDA